MLNFSWRSVKVKIIFPSSEFIETPDSVLKPSGGGEFVGLSLRTTARRVFSLQKPQQMASCTSLNSCYIDACEPTTKAR